MAAAVSSSQVDVSWEDVTGESGYRVERSSTGTGGWTQVGTAGQDAASYSDTGLAASTTYYYRVAATSGNGDSAPSTVVSATTLAPPPPAAPGGLAAEAVSSSRIDLGWQDVAGESGYAVQRSATGSGGWTQVGTTGPDVTSYSDIGLAASTAYYYRVIATSDNGNSAPSAVVSATTLAPPPPVTPTGVAATAMSSSQVDVSWADVAGESGYAVQRSADGTGGWTQVGTTGQDVTSFSDVGLAASTAYYYRVIATSDNGDSAASAVVSATTFAPPLPGAPDGVTATAVSSSRIDVAWLDVAGESGYQVQRSLDGMSGWAERGTTGQDVTAFSDTGLAASTTYYYRVVAASGNGNSAPSAVASATTSAAADTTPPTAPSALKGTAAKRKVNLAWTGSVDSGSGVAGYLVYRSGSATGTFTLVATTPSTSVSVAATTNVTFWYRVTAYDFAGNEGSPSGTVSVAAK
jgi:titin